MHTNLILKHLNLLVVDDNQRVHSEMHTLFSTVFKSISLAHDVDTALHLFDANPIDIIITDIEMPGHDGLCFIESIRLSDVNIPIIILSAHTDTKYLLRAANQQVDGYIIKPLSFKKLEPSLTRAVARLEHRINAIDISNHITYHPLYKTLHVDNQQISLGNKECQLLELLLTKRHRVVGKSEIHSAVWPDEEISESALKNLLSELRKKLKYDVIHNQPARGWTLRTRT
ncbi:MAG: response regulator transcription factor [Pseudomonadota bacterium]